MKPSDEHLKPNLIVRAEPGTEVFIIDHNLQTLDQGLGGFRGRVEPGVYQVRFRTGSSLDESFVQIAESGHETIVDAPVRLLESAAPFRGTSPEHYEPARMCSRITHATLGADSGIFVFVRSLGGTVAGYDNPAKGLHLLSANGEQTVDLAEAADHGVVSGLPWAGCSVSVTPGCYRLRSESAWGAQEQVVVASPGWQTQVFLLQEWTDPKTVSGSGSPTDGDIDVAATTVLMARLDEGFESESDLMARLYEGDSESDSDRQAELARIALDNGRSVLSPDDLTSLLNVKFVNPMLGILGAHALANTDEPDLDRLSIVIGNLRQLVADHPDVDALAIAAGLPVNAIWETPPMLASSWRMVVKHSIERPELIPVDSLSAQVPPFLYRSGLWLMWDADSLAAAAPLGAALAESTNNTSYQQIYDALTAATRAVAAATDSPGLSFIEATDVPNLTGVEQSVLEWVNEIVERHTDEPEPSVGLADLIGPPTTDDGVDAQEVQGVRLVGALADAMQLPSTTMLSIAVELTDKINLYLEPG